MKPVAQYTKEGKLVCKWESATTASRELAIGCNNIVSCITKHTKTAGGFQ